MAGRPYVPFIGPSEPVADRKTSSQRAINLYVSGVEGGGEDKSVVLESAPGLEVFTSMPGEVRGIINARGVLYVVAGGTLYSVSSAGVQSSIGSLVSSTGFVSMKETRDQLVLVDGPNGYVMTFGSGTLSRITDPDWRGSYWVEEIDGYAVFVPPSSDQFYISEVDAADEYDALDFSSADSQPDNIVTHRVVRRELMLMGARSIETWINSGEPDFPFTRYNSTPIDVGVVGVRAACNAADTLYWVGQTGRGAAYVYELQGHQPVRISTQAVEEGLAGSTDISQCSMWTYQAEGCEFVAINAPGMPTTWVYDASTRKWHERCELVDGAYTALRVDQVCYAYGEHYATAGSVIYRMSRNVHSIAGGVLSRERTWPHLINPSLEPVAYRGVELSCTTGESVSAQTQAGALFTFIGTAGSTTYEDSSGYGATLANDSAGSALSAFDGGALSLASDILGQLPAAIAFGTDDFEVSFDCYLQTSGESIIIGVGGTTYDTEITFSLGSYDVTNRGIYARLLSDYPDAFSDPAVGRILNSAPAVGEWVAIRFVRTSGTISLYVNGTLSGSRSGMGVDCGSASTNIYIGGAYSDASFDPPYIRNLRFLTPVSSVRDGEITLEVSNDGGYVFGPPLIRSLGAVGRRMQRVRWMMLGASRDRVFRVRVTDPVPVTFHACVVDA